MFNIPLPILFNCWKHHSGFLKEKIKQTVELEDTTLKILIQGFVQIGSSQMDLYTGMLSPRQISNSIKIKLKEKELLDYYNYSEWIKAGYKEYRMIAIEDKSSWTLRLAKEKERFVHIHPARYSPHTIRVKSMTLKTAAASAAYTLLNNKSYININLINDVRIKYLSSPPVKSISRVPGIIEILNLFLPGVN